MSKSNFIFKTIHEERVKVLLELYRKITRTERAFQSFMNPFQGASEPSQEEKAKEAAKTANEFLEFFHDNKIYLSDNLELKVRSINEKLINSWSRFHYTVKFENKVNTKEWIEVWNKVKEEIPSISRELKNEFQKIIGIENE